MALALSQQAHACLEWRPMEKLITLNMTCLWTFHTNSFSHGYLFLNSYDKKFVLFTWIQCFIMKPAYSIIISHDHFIIIMNCILNFSNYVCTLLLQPIVVKCDHVLKKCKHFHCCRSLNNNFFSSFKNLVVVFTVTLPPAVAIHSLIPTHFTNITLSQQLSTITPISF